MWQSSSLDQNLVWVESIVIEDSKGRAVKGLESRANQDRKIGTVPDGIPTHAVAEIFHHRHESISLFLTEGAMNVQDAVEKVILKLMVLSARHLQRNIVEILGDARLVTSEG